MAFSVRRAVGLFYVLTVLSNLNFTLSNWLIFGSSYLHLSYLATLVLIYGPGTLLGGVLQVPAGAVADRFGRKRAFIVAMICNAAGCIPFLVTKDFWWLLVTATPLLGAGSSLSSGSLEAIMSELADSHPTVQFKNLIGNSITAMYAARIVGTACGGVLYSVDPRGPTAAVGVAAMAAGLLCLAVPAFPADRRNRDRDSSRPTLRALISETTKLLHSQPGVRRVLLLLVGFWLSAQMVWLGCQPALRAAGFSPAAIGFCYAGFSAIAAVGSQLVKRLLGRYSAGTILQAMALASGATSLGMLVLPGKLILVATVPVLLALGAARPLGNVYVAAGTPAHMRATALSFVTSSYYLAVMTSWFAGVLMLDNANVSTLFALAAGEVVVVLLLAATKLRVDGNVPTANM